MTKSKYSMVNRTFKRTPVFMAWFLVFSLVVGHLSLGFPLSVFAQEAMSSPAYRIQSDSINFGGNRSSTGTSTVEDTLGELSSGYSNSASYEGDIGYQFMQLDIVPPTQPPSMEAHPVNAQEIEISWGESEDDFGVERYYVYRDGSRIADVSYFPRDYRDDPLHPDTVHSYNVSAVDAAGNESVWSATTTARTLPPPLSGGAPTPGVSDLSFYDLQIASNDTSVALSFKTYVGLATEVYWGTDKTYSSGDLTDSNYTDEHYFLLENLKPDTRYLLKIVLTDKLSHKTTYENIPFRTLKVALSANPPNVINFSASSTASAIDLSWKMPQSLDITEVLVLRSESGFPDSPKETKENKLIFGGIGDHYTDTAAKAGVKYYYTAITRDLAGNFSTGAVASARIPLPGEAPVLGVVEPFGNIPQGTGIVDRKIEKLAMKNFLFIQDGESLPVSADSVTVNGSKNLTVALQSHNLPKTLKTIAVTFVTRPNKSAVSTTPEHFTFILRLNREGTRYESTVASLGVVATFNLKLTVIDFKNQGLKKIQGILVSYLPFDFVLLSTAVKNFFYYGMILSLVALTILGFAERKKLLKKILDFKTAV